MKLFPSYCIAVLLLLLSACSLYPEDRQDKSKISEDEISENSEKLTVAAAANLRFVLEELAVDFERQNSVDLAITFASSGKLCSQIINGAPFDVFLSANMKFPQALYTEGATKKEPRVYALGTLVMWSTKVEDLSSGLQRLMDDDISKIAIASDRNAPYGSAALEALRASAIFEKIKSKLVYGESVSQVNQYVLSESVDIGLTNKSVVLGKAKGQGVWKNVDPSLYPRIEQGVVITNYGEQHHPEGCQVFLNYLFTESAQEILVKYGYLAP